MSVMVGLVCDFQCLAKSNLVAGVRKWLLAVDVEGLIQWLG